MFVVFGNLEITQMLIKLTLWKRKPDKGGLNKECRCGVENQWRNFVSFNKFLMTGGE